MGFTSESVKQLITCKNVNRIADIFVQKPLYSQSAANCYK